MRIASPVILLVWLVAGSANAADTSFNGHIKYQFLYGTYPENSLIREAIGSSSIDNNADVRLRLDVRGDAWDFKTDYQFIVRSGDTLGLTQDLGNLPTIPESVPSDDTRLFNLTHVITENENRALVQRLDRLSVGYQGASLTARFGRQAISWGNGLVYTPMDFINPFDPAAVDKEYKTGDDMLYGQYLQDNGNDLQLVWVIRRDADSGNIAGGQSSTALKYHGLAGGLEYDLLVAKHYSDTVLGFGGSHAIGGAVWQGDLVVTRTDNETVPSLVSGLSYSWVAWGKNVSGVLEYFYNGFGVADGDYSPAKLVDKQELVDRLSRGELFNLGRHYVVASAMVEITPLWLLTPNLFTNIADPSALFQLVSQYDILQDLQLLAALNIPIGAPGTEYGGVDTGIDGSYLSSGPGLFVQLAWYF